ncbi:MAG: bifunctional (p)ppGpp synthetase/guanosine-3',5'-bis(diphosphate) 3'-pyrophosphohydrolase [Pseudomonadota bacterium]
MMRQYELVERVQRYNPTTDEALLNKAYVYAMRKHGTQKRASGDPYFSHPLEVAGILTDLHMDDATIVAALLHDTVEDTDATTLEIEEIFGDQISHLVEGLTKIKRLDLVSKKAAQAENLRKLLLAVADDIRVLLVKMADRLHNMRTLNYVPPEKRARIAEETMDIYAPLAGRMGMHSMREELEHLAFQALHPEQARLATEQIESKRAEFDEVATQIENDVRAELTDRGMNASVSWRMKRPYSVWQKMQRKAITFEKMADVLAFRIIVDTVEQCYRTLGLVHAKWPMVPGRFKDYISLPKPNDYRSIHTTILGTGSHRIELQIRTRAMHEVAEYGIASHAIYKEEPTARRPKIEENRSFRWLRELIEMIEAGDSPEDFLEHTKLELFQDQVFCFTPKGRLITLPRGATPIDFAYAVHTDVGNSCVGCKINGHIAPLMSKLVNGEEVEIIRSKSRTPPAAWETIAVTGKARASIRRANRESIRTQYADLGRQILTRIFVREGTEYSDGRVRQVLSKLARQDLNDVLVAVGRGDMAAENVFRAVYPNKSLKTARAANGEKPDTDDGWFGLKRAMGLKFRIPVRGPRKAANENALPIRGIGNDLPVRFAEDTSAVPGDRIVGIVKPGQGITIYPIHARELRLYEDQPDLWLDVRWDDLDDGTGRYPAQIKVVIRNEPGSLGQVANTLGEESVNIENLKFVRRTDDFHELQIDLEVADLTHLNRVLGELRRKAVVNAALRVGA